jgi:hypothetical protein
MHDAHVQIASNRMHANPEVQLCADRSLARALLLFPGAPIDGDTEAPMERTITCADGHERLVEACSLCYEIALTVPMVRLFIWAS